MAALNVNALRQVAAEVEARKAAEEARHREAEDAKRKELLDELSKPLVADEKAIERGLSRVGAMVQAAAERGRTEVLAFRFPNQLTTDKGRAINVGEADWPRTLSGRPQQVYQFWQQHLAPQGFRLRAMVVDYPGGMPGDIGFFLAWGEEPR
ncbi:hypothetical protein [Elioraea sp.]|uniref:hypothetical protein n=1 Tax=Elioraea sp. TaxID=2185103 RepID=UPI0025BA0A67|nr:hypothetical protein [Elioraea sp.]